MADTIKTYHGEITSFGTTGGIETVVPPADIPEGKRFVIRHINLTGVSGAALGDLYFDGAGIRSDWENSLQVGDRENYDWSGFLVMEPGEGFYYQIWTAFRTVSIAVSGVLVDADDPNGEARVAKMALSGVTVATTIFQTPIGVTDILRGIHLCNKDSATDARASVDIDPIGSGFGIHTLIHNQDLLRLTPAFDWSGWFAIGLPDSHTNIMVANNTASTNTHFRISYIRLPS